MNLWLLLAALAVLAALGLAAWAWIRRERLRRVPVRRAPKLRHPVVLAHGILGFDEIALAGSRHRYFRNIGDRFETSPFHYTRVAALGSVAVRAQQLVEVVRALPGERVNVIAHSMGGLDARYAISRLGLADRVASLVTIGAPHHGTPLASMPLSQPAARLLRIEALRDLTPRASERFNLEAPDAPGVAYFSVVCAASLCRTNPLLWPSHLYLRAVSGPNDGIVPAASQRWGTVLREVEADHWAQVGWSLTFDAAGLYEELLRELAALGF